MPKIYSRHHYRVYVHEPRRFRLVNGSIYKPSFYSTCIYVYVCCVLRYNKVRGGSPRASRSGWPLRVDRPYIYISVTTERIVYSELKIDWTHLTHFPSKHLRHFLSTCFPHVKITIIGLDIFLSCSLMCCCFFSGMGGGVGVFVSSASFAELHVIHILWNSLKYTSIKQRICVCVCKHFCLCSSARIIHVISLDLFMCTTNTFVMPFDLPRSFCLVRKKKA